MSLLLADLLYGTTCGLLGAAGASWLCRSYYQGKAVAEGGSQARHAAEVLVRLQELATRVAFDVDEHSNQVQQINNRLASADPPEPTMIVDVVAKLIQTNHHMHEKLASTEDKLREQAQKIQAQAAEARTDALTLLANRRAFDDELARRVCEFRRHGRPFSLIMADVDHFKAFNDEHGHPAGDEVLRGVAKLLRRKMREMDLVARYGGEEFAIVLPGTNVQDAVKAALRACEGLEKSRFRHEGADLQVTASFGVSQVQGAEEGTDVVARADKALYAAKASGRNCVCWHDREGIERAALSGPVEREPSKPTAGQPAGGERETLDAGDPAGATGAAAVAEMELTELAHLPSRSTFCQQVRSRTAEWKRGGPTFSVALLEVNQSEHGGGMHGQLARQSATKAAMRFLTATLREMDVIAHYAPDCFALLMPTAGLADAIRVAERLREGCAHCRGENEEGSRLTLSVGVVQVMEEDDSISLLKRAEAALDAADRRGGDRAYYHDGERPAPITAMLETLDYLS